LSRISVELFNKVIDSVEPTRYYNKHKPEVARTSQVKAGNANPSQPLYVSIFGSTAGYAKHLPIF
jgi:hypothetical protein